MEGVRRLGVVELIVAGQQRELPIREYRGQRVVSAQSIADLHGRETREVGYIFERNQKHFAESQDFFRIARGDAKSTSDAFADLFTSPRQTDAYLFTESGYLMLVKSFTDDLAWEVQRQLVNGYFRAKELSRPTSIEDLIIAQAQALKEARLQAEAAQTEAASAVALAERAHHRIDSLDTISIEGSLRQRFEKMVRRYAYDRGLTHPAAWHHYDQAYNTAYHTNLTMLRNNFCAKHGLRDISRPDYFDRTGRLEDAVRVADKMLNA